MAAPATLPPLPAASSLPSALATAPSSTPGGDAPGTHAFGQQLQAVRNSQSDDAPPDANRQGDPSSSTDAAKPARESNMATVGSAPATAGAASAASANASSKASAATNGQALDAALAAMAQPAQAAAGTGSGDAAPSATTKTSTSKTDPTDDEGAASLAGAMLAMLGQVNGNMAGAQSDADDGTVSADGSSSGQAKAAMLLQGGLGANGQAQTADGATGAVTGNAASLANFVGMLGTAAGASVDTSADTHKASSGQDALAFTPTPMLTQAASTQAVALPQLQIASPAGSAGFAGELGQQVTWLGQQGIQQAKIRLNPQDLGSLDVHVTVNQNRIDVVFSAQHPAAVTAVQQSLPQLDNMLNRHGLSLGHAEVGQQQGGNPHSRGEGGGAPASSADEIGEVQGTALSAATTSQIGLLDAFA